MNEHSIDPHKKWYKLDNAAKIYPAAKSRNWTAMFRVSATLTEPVDPAVLEQALRRTAPRLPGFSLRLRPGLFWYYLERVDDVYPVEPDVANPCARIDLRSNGGLMYRVRYHENRIALEVFHVLTDGTGGMTFLRTLVAEYLTLRYGAVIPRSKEILDCGEPPRAGELEDSFAKYARRETLKRGEAAAYRLRGTSVDRNLISIITGTMPADAVLAKAKARGVTVTEYLTSVLIMAVYAVEQNEISAARRRMPVKVCVPVNLRKFYGSETLRNFASFVNPGIDPRFGKYTFPEVLRQVKSFMGLETSEKMMNARMSANVVTERNALLRATPLFLKNPTMSLAFRLNGDRTSSTTLSNLGDVKLPDEMAKYVTRLEFMLGALKFNPVACAVVSYNGTMCVNFTRAIAESAVERGFFTFLVREGIPVKIESNRSYD
ncbi:MAG: alcohol acetyltransferase [Oscillospiraceae bacterium]|nr:alcohol acetyltransferase [Oscillospiraceae bacterium]